MSPGAAHKYDEDKPRLDLVPPGIIEAVGIIRTYGTEKYGDPHGWKQVEPNRYTAALMRHLCKYLDNPKSVDEESGLPHLWHMACNIAFLIEFQRTQMSVNNGQYTTTPSTGKPKESLEQFVLRRRES